ncbi:hypothetical protein B0H13DRAFT_1867846 [Mycena leptocephala]|nr:hypothetical protein B0H13DRAFT_1867846 [Mycena leptocephala]
MCSSSSTSCTKVALEDALRMRDPFSPAFSFPHLTDLFVARTKNFHSRSIKEQLNTTSDLLVARYRLLCETNSGIGVKDATGSMLSLALSEDGHTESDIPAGAGRSIKKIKPVFESPDTKSDLTPDFALSHNKVVRILAGKQLEKVAREIREIVVGLYWPPDAEALVAGHASDAEKTDLAAALDMLDSLVKDVMEEFVGAEGFNKCFVHAPFNLGSEAFSSKLSRALRDDAFDRFEDHFRMAQVIQVEPSARATFKRILSMQDREDVERACRKRQKIS